MVVTDQQNAMAQLIITDVLMWTAARAYGLLKEKRACKQAPGKFKRRLKIVKSSICTVVARQLMLL